MSSSRSCTPSCFMMLSAWAPGRRHIRPGVEDQNHSLHGELRLLQDPHCPEHQAEGCVLHNPRPYLPCPHAPHNPRPYLPCPHAPHNPHPYLPRPHAPHNPRPYLPRPHAPHNPRPYLPCPDQTCLSHLNLPHLSHPYLPRLTHPYLPCLSHPYLPCALPYMSPLSTAHLDLPAPPPSLSYPPCPSLPAPPAPPPRCRPPGPHPLCCCMRVCPTSPLWTAAG